MATITVLDASSLPVAIEKPLPPARAAAAASRPVVLSTEDKAALDAIATLLMTQAGYLDGIEGLIGTTNGKDFATQTTLAAILAKIIAAPATEATLAAISGLLTTQAGYLDGIEGLIGTTNGKDFATQTTLAAVLTKLTAGATTIAKVEDVQSADADVGVPAMAVRIATAANRSGTDGDYEMLQMFAGRLWVSATLDASAGTRVETTVAVGGTAVVLFGATPTNGFEVVNPHATEWLYIREGAAATVADNSVNIPIAPRGSYVTPVGYKPTGDVTYNAATTGHAVIGRRW